MDKLSFFDWCISNDYNYMLDRWDYEKNTTSPKDIYYSSSKKFYFTCENGQHESELHRLSDVAKHRKLPGCSVCQSFGVWCEHNNRLDLIKRWDYSKNTISPYEISISSTKKQYFLCPRGIHESESKDLNNIRKQYGSCLCQKCNSIGQYGIDNIDPAFESKYWSIKNTISPLLINKNSTKKIWIKCNKTDYHPDYEISTVNFYKGERCPYCRGFKVCYEDSIAAKYGQVVSLWSDINDTLPSEYTSGQLKKVWWKCENNIHQDYKKPIYYAVKNGFLCPKCIRENRESYLQTKVRMFLESQFTEVLHEYDCNLKPINTKTGHILPYDNEIPEIKMIVETNGPQHYSVKPFIDIFRENEKTPEESFMQRKELDLFKKQYAVNNGYTFVEIPYWTDNNKESWKKILIDAISKAKKNLYSQPDDK